MTDAAETAAPTDAPPRRGKLGLILGALLALGLGGAGFYAVYAGFFDPAALLAHETEAGGAPAEVAFVAMDPIMLSLPPGSSARHLRFAGQLEVAPGQAVEVAALMPRILDVLNTYLRAVDVSDLEEPFALPRLRAQMLRRLQVVVGEGRVRDLLVTEFVLN